MRVTTTGLSQSESRSEAAAAGEEVEVEEETSGAVTKTEATEEDAGAAPSTTREPTMEPAEEKQAEQTEEEPMETEDGGDDDEPAAEEEAEEESTEKRGAEEVADEEDTAAEGEAQQQETEEAVSVQEAPAGLPEGPEFFETTLEQLKVESEAPFAKVNGSNYFHVLEEKFLGKLTDEYKNKSNYKIFYTKVDNAAEGVNSIYGCDWNSEKNAKILHSNQGFAYVAKPEFPSYREVTVEEMQAVIASQGADNVAINGSNYFHALEKKFRDAVNSKFGAESQAFIAWFNKSDNVEAAVNELYGRDWNAEENAKILHRSQGFAFVIQRVEEEE